MSSNAATLLDARKNGMLAFWAFDALSFGHL